MANPEGKDCFGKFWEESAEECYKQCSAYADCKKKMQSDQLLELRAKSGAPKITYSLPSPTKPVSSYTIPIKQPGSEQSYTIPTRPPTTTTSLPIRPVQPTQPHPTHQPAQYPVYQTPQPQTAHVQQAQPQQLFPSVFVPTMTLQPHESPPFLTVLEPVVKGESPWMRILIEALRAAMKGMLSHGSYVVDHTPLYRQ